MRKLLAVMVLLPTLAHADEQVLATTDEWAAQQQVERERAHPYWDTCKKVWQRSPYVVAGWNQGFYIPPSSFPSPPAPAAPTGGGSGGSLGGGGRPEILLVLAVVALAIAPIIVYAVDSDADPLTTERFYCPEFSFGASGGVQVSTGAGAQPFGLGVAKLRAEVGYVGGMAELGLAGLPGAGLTGSFSAHFLLRAKPKKHIEGALALGGRRAIGPGGTLDGVEVALPHTYVFDRDGYRKLGLELMPRFFWNRSGLDVGADLNLVIPVADVLQVRVGGAVFTHAQQIQLGATAGVNAYF
ncbi:MAG: hypothetical protein IPJ65_32200 [Archangiaceae bacterium]|nr:hypothetical protein [Archangiaceae bacterium]